VPRKGGLDIEERLDSSMMVDDDILVSLRHHPVLKLLVQREAHPTLIMSTRELFGDDSSDSDGEEPPKSSVDKPTDAEASKETDGADKPTEKKDAVDDDEDDAEFDDKGEVVGLKSTTIAGSKLASTESQAPDPLAEEQDAEAPPPNEKWVIPEAKDPRPPALRITKLPNLVGIQTKPFDPDTYSAALEEDEFEGQYHLIRWRKDGDKIESNTKLVEWDDGSWTLHIGEEALAVDHVRTATADGFAGLNGYVYLSQKAKEPENTTVLECLGPVESRLVIKPSSLQSEAHKALTLAVRQRTTKRARIEQFTTTEDPEKLKEQRIKIKADLEKAEQRQRQQRSYSQSSGPRRPRMSRQYLEDDDDDEYDTTNIRSMKRNMYDDFDDGDDYGDDSEEDETFSRARKKSKSDATDDKTSKKGEDDDDEEDVGGFGGDDDDDDEEVVAPVKKASADKSKSLFDEDSD